MYHARFFLFNGGHKCFACLSRIKRFVTNCLRARSPIHLTASRPGVQFKGCSKLALRRILRTAPAMKVFVCLFVALKVAAQTIYLAGDSTMAVGGGGSGTQGWGVPFASFVNIPVVNDGVAGTSARSYSDQGRFNTIVNLVRPGDFVIIEFGHNDAAANPDNGKQDAVGDGYNITSTVTAANGTQILIHSFHFYIENAVNAIKAKGAIPIIASLTPDNIWTNATTPVIAAGGRFVTYAHTVSVDTSIVYVDHFSYVAQNYNKLGKSFVSANYYTTADHLHTLPAGATNVAQAFVRGLLCSTSTLKSHVNAAGQAAPNGCL
ncbi:Rhamnogalacturonan acetylesterase [Mycena kentingensis (nom. inval.)]|nr:Rhamnogalacturonan acetylesterase [Mycena kentingensis (nom. inval.)]